MTGKIFKTIFCVLNIGAMQLAVLGCLKNRDCSNQLATGSRKQKCCYSVQPPRCMDRFSCFLARTAKTTKAPFPSDYTLPDYDIPDISPDNNYDNYDNDYNSSDSTSSSPGAISGFLLAVMLLIIFIRACRCLRLEPGRRNDVCVVRPPVETTNATSRTNLVSQESERPSLVTIAFRPDEGESVRQNVPPEGEPPFLSEDDTLQSLQSPSDPEPPSLDLPKYEELPLLPYDTAQVPNPSLNTIPIQPNVDLSAVNPPS